jgi:hypothetical protein
MKIDIDKLSESELIELNHRIVRRLRFLNEKRAHTNMMRFSIGERVSFTPEGRPLVTGLLTKYNRKTVTVITESGERWNVSPGLLQKAKGRIESQDTSHKVVYLKKDK